MKVSTAEGLQCYIFVVKANGGGGLRASLWTAALFLIDPSVLKKKAFHSPRGHWLDIYRSE